MESKKKTRVIDKKISTGEKKIKIPAGFVSTITAHRCSTCALSCIELVLEVHSTGKTVKELTMCSFLQRLVEQILLHLNPKIRVKKRRRRRSKEIKKDATDSWRDFNKVNVRKLDIV